ncbi:MAG: hypothetical protein GY788_06845 [bacterium]|nr:hypothetical protein [bacterium]
MFFVFGLLLQLAVIGGIVFVIANAIRGRSDRAQSGAGGAISIRRLFQYALLLTALVVAAFGVGGILGRIISDADARRSSELAGPLALAVVGVPVFWFLGRWIWQQVQTDPLERDSLGWSLYINVVLLGSILTAVSTAFAIADKIIGDSRYDGNAIAAFLVATAIWAGHWLAWRRVTPSVFGDFHIMAGATIGLGSMAGGTGFIIGSAIDRAFVQAGGVDAAEFFGEDLAMAVVAIGIGMVVWSWHWLYNGLAAERTTLWHAYVILVGILGGLVAAVTGGAIALFLLLQWIFGDPGASSAAIHFQDASPAFAASILGVASWFYHKTVLGFDRGQQRTDIDRVYDYLVSGVALTTVAGALTTLIVAVLSVFGTDDVVSDGGSDVNIVITAVTLLIVGAPLWSIAWHRAQQALSTNQQAESSSSARRIYLFAVFGIGGAIAFGALTRLVFVLFEAVLGERSGGTLLDDLQIPFALIATTGAVAAYHWSVYRAERHVEEPITWRNVTLVWPGGNISEIEERSHVHISTVQRLDTPETQPVDAIVAAINETEGTQLLVVVSPDRVDAIPVVSPGLDLIDPAR